MKRNLALVLLVTVVLAGAVGWLIVSPREARTASMPTSDAGDPRATPASPPAQRRAVPASTERAERVAPARDDDDRTRHALINSGYGTHVRAAASDDEGERGGHVSYQDDAPVGALTWPEETEGAEPCSLVVVVTGEGGQPAAGVFVSLRREEKWETILHLGARTDDEGRVVVRELPVSYYRASIEEDDSLPHTRSWRCDGGHEGEVALSKRAGDTRLFGHVLEEGTDAPLAGTKLTIQEITKDDAKDFHTYSFLTVDDDGAFDIKVVGGKDWQYRLYASAPGYEFTNADVFVKEGEHRRMTFHLKPMGRIEGDVVQEDGSPAAGAHVQQRGRSGVVGVVADGEGHFSMSMRDGESLSVVAHLGSALGSRRVSPPLRKGETRTGLRITLRPGRTITGVVKNAGGEPFPFAELIASEQGQMGWLETTQADAEGRFTIEGAPGLRLNVLATGSRTRAHIPRCASDDPACFTREVGVEVPFVVGR